MEQSLKDKWIKALRSGDYEQIEGYLHTPNGYCCLGVLTEVDLGSDCWNPLGEYDGGKSYSYGECESFEELHSTHQYEMGMTTYVMSILIEMNDSGSSFNDIADWIEENL